MESKPWPAWRLFKSLFTVMEDLAVPATPGRNTQAWMQASQMSSILLPSQAADCAKQKADIHNEGGKHEICYMSTPEARAI